jgi:hypothetical protein
MIFALQSLPLQHHAVAPLDGGNMIKSSFTQVVFFLTEGTSAASYIKRNRDKCWRVYMEGYRLYCKLGREKQQHSSFKYNTKEQRR